MPRQKALIFSFSGVVSFLVISMTIAQTDNTLMS